MKMETPTNSVGYDIEFNIKGLNHPKDVKIVQKTIVTKGLSKIVGKVDGIFGPKTFAGILEFQRISMLMPRPTGLIRPSDPKWKKALEVGLIGLNALSRPIFPPVFFHERSLTSGEIAMARQVFGDSINYREVKVHDHGYPFLFGGQGRGYAVTPNGEIYFLKADYRADFSKPKVGKNQKPNDIRRWFIHEMTHAWQFQLDYGVKANGAWLQGLLLLHLATKKEVYGYVLDENKKLSDYNMEQQADIISNYHYMKFLGEPSINKGGVIYTSATLPIYEKILSKFLNNPASPSNLPK
jgi:hypothetical protein